MLEATHKEDVLDKLKNGIIDDDISAILRKEAEQIVSQFKA